MSSAAAVVAPRDRSQLIRVGEYGGARRGRAGAARQHAAAVRADDRRPGARAGDVGR